MSDNYAGTPGSFPATITTITDDDVISASAVSVPLEQLADRTATLGEAACFVSDGSTFAHNANLTLVALYAPTGYSVDGSDVITLPGVGVYEANFSCSLKFSDTANPLEIYARLGFCNSVGGSFDFLASAVHTRATATAANWVHLSGCAIFEITDPLLAFLRVACTTGLGAGAGTFTPDNGQVTIRRIR